MGPRNRRSNFGHPSTMKCCLPLLIAFLVPTGLLSAQAAGSGENQIFSSDLIAWSGMQQPQEPERQQEPPHNPDYSAPSQDQSTSHNPTQAHPDSEASESQNRAPAAAIFTGTVSKEGDDMVLKVSETTTYKLDSKQPIEQFDGQRVRVTGTFESGVNIIHVDRIEPLS
jgi:hypothetical protein